MRNVAIASYQFRHDGEHARGFLADAGIGSVLAGIAADPPASPDAFQLFVREGDADRARALLDDADDLEFS